MTLELSRLTEQVQGMGTALAARQERLGELVGLARQWLARYADRGEGLRAAAREAFAAIPAGEPLDAQVPLPAAPERFTFIATDGAQIGPDSHDVAYYYLINVGSMVYRHGSGQAPEAHSRPTVGYSDDDIYDQGQPVSGNLLDIRRDLAEITTLAELSEDQSDGAPVAAVVDGTLILWTLKDTPVAYQAEKARQYLDALDRIQAAGAGLAACISRPRRGEVARLLHLANVEGDPRRASEEPNPLQRLSDHAIFAALPPGARSALFVSPASINHDHYARAGHTVHFFYANLAAEGHEPAIARIEIPAWVAGDGDRLALVHAAIVAQARITGDYPYALVRADELAFISGPEREAFADMVTRSLLHAGVRATLSPKRHYKTLTRQGKRKFR